MSGSDLVSIVALWDHLREQQRQLSGNQFRKLCRAEFLNYLRVREWQDLYSQLRQVAGELGLRASGRAGAAGGRASGRAQPACCRTSGCATGRPAVPRRPRLVVRDRSGIGARPSARRAG